MDLQQFRVEEAPPTVHYIPNFVTSEEADYLWKQVYTAPKPKWKQLSNRRLQNWGGVPQTKGMMVESLPKWLSDCCSKIDGLGVFGENKIPNHVLINEYTPGQGIMPHEDGPLYHPVVTTISLGSHTVLDFYKPISGSDLEQLMDASYESRYTCSLLLEPRSLLVLQDDMYTSKDEHCVIVDDDNGWYSDMDDFEFPLANIGSEKKSDTKQKVDVNCVETESSSQEECTNPNSDNTVTDNTPVLFQSLEDVITHLQQFLKQELQEFQVRREFVLEDLLQELQKPSFNPLKRVQTWFIGEMGRDTGGVTRELWCLLNQSLVKLCEGHPTKLVFRHDSDRVVSGDFKRIGILVGMSLVNGGSGFPYFAPALYSYISGQEVQSIVITVDEVPNAELHSVLVKLIDAKDDEVGQIAMDACDILIENGCSQGLAQLKKSDVPQIVRSASLGCTIIKIKAALDQFMAGLDAAGVLHAIQQYPDLLRPMFVASDNDPLSADFILDGLLAKKVFSEAGSISLTMEQSTYVFFRRLLNEVEGGVLDITLGEVLSFFTGTNRIPPLGFADATLNFSPTNPYPTASTCALTLTLPTKYTSYAEFKSVFVFSMQSHGGFGLY